MSGSSLGIDISPRPCLSPSPSLSFSLSPTMELKKLTKYIPDQQSKINKLVKESNSFYNSSSEGALPHWAAFRDILWEKGLTLLQAEAQEEAQEEAQKEAQEEGHDGTLSDPATRQFVKLPEIIAKLLHFESSHILIRSEYEEAEGAALKANENGTQAFLVGGQSGIGSPLSFLILICGT